MMRAAIVGLGWWGKLMVREAQAKAPSMTITEAVVRDPEVAEAFAAECGLRLSTDLAATLARDDIDALIIASPHVAHVDQIVAAANAGKAIYTEKPISLSLDDARRAIEATQSAGVLLGIGTDRRFLPAMRKLFALVDDGTLGTLLHLEGQYSNDFMSQGLSGKWRMDESLSPGAGLSGPGLHALDAMIRLSGPVAALTGQMIRPQGNDIPVDAVSLMLRFVSGQSGLIGVVRGVPNYFRLAVYGTGGIAELRAFAALSINLKGEAERVETYPAALAIGETMQIFAESWIKGEPFPVSPSEMLTTQAAFSTALTALSAPGWHNVPAL